MERDVIPNNKPEEAIKSSNVENEELITPFIIGYRNFVSEFLESYNRINGVGYDINVYGALDKMSEATAQTLLAMCRIPRNSVIAEKIKLALGLMDVPMDAVADEITEMIAEWSKKSDRML